MTTASNLYAEKIFAEHPLAIWPLDDSADYISLISEAQRNISTWTLTSGTVTSGSVPTANSIEQTEPFPNSHRKVFVPTTPTGSTVTSYLKSANLINFEELNAPLQTFAISTYYYAKTSKIQSIAIGYEYSSGDPAVITSVFETFSSIELNDWIPISKTFTFPTDIDAEFKIVFKIISSTGGSAGDYDVQFNGITVGQHSEEFNATSLGQTKGTLPVDINLSLDGVIDADAYGLNAEKGYYVVEDNSLTAKNFGVPLVYGSARAVEITPHSVIVDYRTWDQVADESWSYWEDQEESWTDVNLFTQEEDLIVNTKPSFIFPGYGFLNESGRNNNYTLEFWLQADANTTDAKRILGPISSTDGLYVKDCFLTLAIDGNFVSHYVGEWFRPMIVHIKIIRDEATLMVNGEDVGTLLINTSTMTLPPEYSVEDPTRSNDWIGIYAYETLVDQIKIDCIAIYPYSILNNAAKFHYILGQGVPKTPQIIDSYYGGVTAEIDYSFANYSNNVTFPTTRAWSSGSADTLVPDVVRLKTPNYVLPNFVLTGSSGTKTIKELEADNKLIQDETNKFFTLKPSNEWTDNSYVYFENLSFLSNSLDSIVGTFKVTEDEDGTLLFLQKESSSFSIERESGNLKYLFRHNLAPGDPSVVIKSVACPVGIFSAGIQISKLLEESLVDGLSQFFSNPSSLKLYIGSRPNSSNMFTGNIYKVSINTFKHTNTISTYFEEDGTADADANFIDHVGSYSLFSFEDYGGFFIDIATFGYWESYTPLTSLAKNSLNVSGETVLDIDFIQFNFDYPSPSEIQDEESGEESGYWIDNNESINTDSSNVRAYVTFQNIVDNVTQTDFEYTTTMPALKNKILDLNEEANWETKRFEIVDNYLIYPSKVVDFNDIAIVYLLTFKVFGILHNQVSLRKLEIAAKTFNATESNPITTRYAIDIEPYVLEQDSGSTELYDYKAQNSYLIDKEGAPYLYLTRKSGIELIGGTTNLDRGISIDINPTEIDLFPISAIQLFLRLDLWGFPQNPILIFEIENAVDTLEFYIQANSSNADRGRIFAKTKSNDLPYSLIDYYVDGLYVSDPTLSIQRWAVLGMSFPTNLNFNAFNGKINLRNLMTFNNISFYKGTNAQLQISNIYRSWAEVEDESWSYWDNGTNAFAIADWNNVLMKRRDSRYVVNAGEVYNNYTGTNKIIIDDNEGIYLETNEVSVIKDAIWQNSVLPPA